MNHSPQDPRVPGPLPGSYSGSASQFAPSYATLRLIANPPVPEGLEDSVRRALRAAPQRATYSPGPRD